MQLSTHDKQTLITNIINQYDAGKFFDNIHHESSQYVAEKDRLTPNTTTKVFIFGFFASVLLIAFTNDPRWFLLSAIMFALIMLSDSISSLISKLGKYAAPVSPRLMAMNTLRDLHLTDPARGINNKLFQRFYNDIIFNYFLKRDDDIKYVFDLLAHDGYELSTLNKQLLGCEQKGDFDSHTYRDLKKTLDRNLLVYCHRLVMTCRKPPHFNEGI